MFPIGWDKSYCLKFLEEYETVHFYGDKCEKGGNDYELYIHPRAKGHAVTDYKDTIK